MKLLIHSLFILAPIWSFTQAKAPVDSMSFYFERNSSQINLQHKRNSETKTKLSKLKEQTVVLRAYTDSTGSTESNRKLAEQRLEATKKLLTETYPNQFTIRTELAIGEDLSQKSDADKRRVDILASNSRKKRTFVLNEPIKLGIRFVYGMDELIKGSNVDIQFLIETLKSDNTLQVTLAGHVCCGTDSQNLSGKRAEKVKQILITEGKISADRITATGYGNTKPLYPDEYEWQRQANRRVEATFYKK